MKALIASALLATAAVFFYLGTQTAAPVVVAPAPVAATPIVDPFKAPAEQIQWDDKAPAEPNMFAEFTPEPTGTGCPAGLVMEPNGMCNTASGADWNRQQRERRGREQQNEDLARAIADEQERRERRL